MKTISELSKYYKTDKMNEDGHCYAEIYDRIFEPRRETVTDLMEIGILKHPNTNWCPYEGASILMWNDYFTNAQIHGVDIVDHTKMDRHGSDRIHVYIKNQGDRMQLKYLMENEIGKQMDIIVDDGSHFMHHQQVSLAFLFPYVKSGGIYVVEDLFTSHPIPPFSPMQFQLTPQDTLTQDMLHDFVKNKKMVSMFMKDEEIKYLEENIKECIIEKGAISEIAFIIKK